MYTTTSRTFEPGPGSRSASVILWWGTEVRVLAPDGELVSRTLADREDPVACILASMPRPASSAETARIAYHPGTVEIHEIECQNTGKARLHRHLSRDHPALKSRGTLWAVDSIRRCGRGIAALLYIDARSQLPRLVDGLTRRGFRTEGAWPLQSLVDAGSEESSWAVVAIQGRALVSCLDSNGDGFVRYREGEAYAEEALADFSMAVALLEGDRSRAGLFAAEEGLGAAALRERLGAAGSPATSIVDFLAGARLLPVGGPSDFMPRKPMVSRKGALTWFASGLGVALAAGSVVSARSTWQDQEHTQRMEAEAGDHRNQLRASIDSRRAIQEKIHRLEQALSELRVPPQREFDLLMALSRITPSQVEILEISTQAGNFLIRGRCDAGIAGPDGLLEGFRRDLGFEGAPWSLTWDPAGPHGQEFVWHGAFH